ncbi:glycosyltransferase [Niabella yanshanensis]|uniref:Glycosyltransferase n=1 Tax=Niabella yanshanensis TaxID=577386 RepID=A0ABZ0W731_9BACT|nr:glycosyltransferase [Niabella yanshanensis]WQD37337.1 glycosyltransferase [Niabella yanshanensis]
MLEKVFGVVILYNPTKEVLDNISSYRKALDHLAIIDNSERLHAVQFEENEQVTFFADGENRGISERLNQAAAFAKSRGAKWLLTMDQDSFFSEYIFDRYLNCVAVFSGRNEVAMFGVEFESTEQREDCFSEDTDNLITSGSLLNLDLFEKIGEFDINLFIDEVDFDYCIRSIRSGLRIVRFKNICMHHSLGIVHQRRSFKTFKITSRTLHPPLRLYYMVRNYLYLRDKYGAEFPAAFGIKRTDLLNRIKNRLLYGNARLETFRYLLKAYRHYRSAKMGKYKY